MDYCKYHPLRGATWKCQHCAVFQCDHCVDEHEHQRDKAWCFVCGEQVESLGSINTVEPFWRRLKEAFKYPLNSASLSLIVATAVISLIATLIPLLFVLAIVLALFAAGAMMKYSFACLERTALGEMKAPRVMDAWQGGIALLAQLIIMGAVLGLAVGLSYFYLGAAAGGFLGFVAVISIPAILIRFAQTENLIEALNPLAAIGLIGAIGLPYGLLIVFILIMMTSVGVLNEWIGTLFPAGSYFLQSIVSNYYTVVIFHLMGYILFQYQDQLGYRARAEHDDDSPKRSEVEQRQAKIEVLLKEGDYERVIDLYQHAQKKFPDEDVFFEKYFELLYAFKKPDLLADYALAYLEFLNRKKRFDKLLPAFKQILLLAPEYLPDSAPLRVQLASRCKRIGDLKLAVKLLNGLHKLYPDFFGLPEAYELMAEVLTDIPKMKPQAERYREMARQLRVKIEKLQTLQARQQMQKITQAKPALPGLKARTPPPAAQFTTASGLKLELVPMGEEKAETCE